MAWHQVSFRTPTGLPQGSPERLFLGTANPDFLSFPSFLDLFMNSSGALGLTKRGRTLAEKDSKFPAWCPIYPAERCCIGVASGSHRGGQSSNPRVFLSSLSCSAELPQRLQDAKVSVRAAFSTKTALDQRLADTTPVTAWEGCCRVVVGRLHGREPQPGQWKETTHDGYVIPLTVTPPINSAKQLASDQ